MKALTLSGALTADEDSAVHSGAWFASLGPSLQRALLSKAATWRVGHGQLIAGQGVVPDTWFGLAAGAMRVSVVTDHGKEGVTHIVRAGEWFGDVPLLAAKPLPYSCHTLGPCTLLMMRRGQLCELLAHHPGLSEALSRLNWEHALHVMDRHVAFVTQPLEPRVRELLGTLGDNMATPGSRAVHGQLKQSDLALLLGASRQRVNQAIARLGPRSASEQSARRRDPSDVDVRI
ncbi:MAG: Crp/Fnr family transcriptional regulator [Burkholderiaceae bacterium]